MLGEKGVGRFASAKLSEELRLVTRPSGSNETTLDLLWSDFEDEQRYLDEIPVRWEQRAAKAFAKKGRVGDLWANVESDHLHHRKRKPSPTHGTLLRLARTRATWDIQRLTDLRTSLARLVSPNAISDEVEPDFTIVLDLPDDFGLLSGVVEPPSELRDAHYRLDATVDASGHAEGSIVLKDAAAKPLDFRVESPDGELTSDERPLACGPFRVSLRVWDRDIDSLASIAPGEKASSVRSTLDAAAGVSVYRDGFRVLPYGEPKDDWLRLDLRRVQSPTRRLSNNQIVGYVSIGRDANPDLKDQTNREGLVEGPALTELRHALLQLLTRLESERYAVRPRRKRKSKGGLLDRIDLGELRSAIAARLPDDGEVVSMITDLQREIDERNEQVGETLARYHRLATLGQLVDRVVHEITQPLLATRQAATLGLDRLKATRKGADPECLELVDYLGGKLDIAQVQSRVAADVVRRIQPFGGRRRGRPPQIKVENAIRDALALLDDEVSRVGARIEVPSGATTVTVDGTELQEVLLNLLTNSLYWLRKVPKKTRRIDVQVSRNADRSVSLIVEDSGPGVSVQDAPHVFDPYFTTREGGVGLGLAIAGEIVEDFYGGTLELLPPGDLGGARFRATLRRRVS